MSSHFYIANSLNFDNFPGHSSSEFMKIELDNQKFTFSKILGGDKSIFFVCSITNRLVEICHQARSHHLKAPTDSSEVEFTISKIGVIENGQEYEKVKIDHHMMKDSNIHNIEYFMGSTNIYLVDKVSGRVGVYTFASGSLRIDDYSKKGGIVKFYCGPLSTYYIVLSGSGMVFENGAAASIQNSSSIVRGACNGRGSIVASRYDLYGRGDDNVFNVFTDKFDTTNGKTRFCHIATFEHAIKDIKCGYFHTVVLLENNELHACGYNCLYQASWSSNLDLSSFRRVNYDFGIIEKIGCTSRGTWVMNSLGEIIMVGEVVEQFSKHIVSGLSTPKIIKFDPKLTYSCDTITNAGWHYMLYQAHNNNSHKFIQKLKSVIGSEHLSDLAFDYEC